MTEYLKVVEDKEDELQSLRSRMMADRGIYFLTPYTMKGYDGKTLNRIDNITSRDPRNFADRIISVLNTAKMTAEITSRKLTDKDTSMIEAFWGLAEERADKRLAKKMMMSVRPTCAFHACVSGWVASRVWVSQDKNGELVFDILPLDPLFLAWDVGDDGLLWAAYRTMRGRAQIELEYGRIIPDKQAEVLNYIDRKVNATLVGKELVREVENPFGEVPFIILPVALTPMAGSTLGDPSAMTNYGESIFSAMRNQEAEYNKFLSILQSLNAQYFRRPTGFRTPEGVKLPEGDFQAPGAKVPLGLQDEFVPVPIGELRESASLFYGIMSGERQRSMLPFSDWGAEPGSEFSDLALARLERQRDQAVLPRIETLTSAYSEMAMMILRQYQNGKFGAVSLEVGGKEMDFKLPELPADLVIKFHLETISPEKDISSYSVAAAARNLGVPQDIIFRDILRFDDPTAAMEKALEEWVAEAVPQIKLAQAARLFERQAKELSGEEAKAKKVDIEMIHELLAQQGETPSKGAAEGTPVPGQAPAAVRSLRGQARRKGMEEAK